jgi:histidine ammonia-lyase
MATFAAQRLREAREHIRTIVAVVTLAAVQGIDVHGPLLNSQELH